MPQKYYDQEPAYIIESKKKCIQLGMKPDEIRTPQNSMSELKLAQKNKYIRKF